MPLAAENSELGLFEERLAALVSQSSQSIVSPLRNEVFGEAGSGNVIGAELKRLEASSGGLMGLSAIHLQDGRTVSYRDSESFPMASTFKIALAMCILQLIDHEKVALDQMVEISADLLVPPPLIEPYFRHIGLAISVANLLDIMMVTSDNSATDALLKLVGGPDYVSQAIAKANIAGMRIDRSTSQFLADFLEIDLTEGQSFASLFSVLPAREKARLYALTEQANNNYDDDERDNASPAAMAKLLAKLWHGNLTSIASRDRLFEVMERCENDNRIKGCMPAHVTIAHKTGTLGGSTSDVGVIELPEKSGSVAIAIYIKKSASPVIIRERAIAHASRAVYDFMLMA